MSYFQETSGTLHYLSDTDIANGGESLLPAGSVAISDAQAEAIQNPPMTLAQSQAAQLATLYAAYQAAAQVSVSYTSAAGVTKTYQADATSQSTLLIATTGYNLAGATPTGFYWVAADNTKVPFTLDDLKGLYAVMLAQGNAAFNKLQMLKAEVRAATTVAAAQAVSWTSPA